MQEKYRVALLHVEGDPTTILYPVVIMDSLPDELKKQIQALVNKDIIVTSDIKALKNSLDSLKADLSVINGSVAKKLGANGLFTETDINNRVKILHGDAQNLIGIDSNFNVLVGDVADRLKLAGISERPQYIDEMDNLNDIAFVSDITKINNELSKKVDGTPDFFIYSYKPNEPQLFHGDADNLIGFAGNLLQVGNITDRLKLYSFNHRPLFEGDEGATQDELALLSDLKGYVKPSDLTGYAKKTDLTNLVNKSELAGATVDASYKSRYFYDVEDPHENGITYSATPSDTFNSAYGDMLAMIDADGVLTKVPKEVVFGNARAAVPMALNVAKEEPKPLPKEYNHHIELTNASSIISFDLKASSNVKIPSISELVRLYPNRTITASGGFKTLEGYSVIVASIKYDVNGLYLSGMKINGGIVKDYLVSDDLKLTDEVGD